MKHSVPILHRAFALLLMCTLLLPLLSAFASLSVSGAEDPTPYISYESPAIPANVGETVDLSVYGVMMNKSAAIAPQKIEWDSGDISIKDGKVTPTEAGVYQLSAKGGSYRKTVYLVVKNPEDTEYVLYTADFDDVTSFDELGYSVIQRTNDTCTTKVQDGKLVLSAQSAGDNYIRVLLPAWLGDFANYRIDADIAMTAWQTASRWMSVMFRVQNNAIPYYQVAVRANATAENGTEIAERTAGDAWDVQYKAPYKKAITDKAFYRYTAEVCNSSIAYLINGEKQLLCADATLNQPGRIGLQVRACEMTVDKISVSLQLTEPEGTKSYFATVEDPKSDIALPPSILTEVADSASYDALKSALQTSGATIPATAVFNIDKSGSILIGEEKLSLDAVLTVLNQRIIPAFRIEDMQAVTPFVTQLKDNNVNDVFILSEHPEVLKAARETFNLCRAILDFSRAEAVPTLAEIRSETNLCGARICLLPDHLATKENVAYLQNLLMTVYTTCESTDTDRLTAIVSGANGILTADFAALATCFTKYFEKGTIVRPSIIIGHRGNPSLAPENTVEGSVYAYELGAMLVENDIQLTKDGVIVVMHDDTIDRTTNGSGKVTSMTYADLQKYAVDAFGDFGSVPIPTLEDYLKTFKDLDACLLIEIKNSDTAICPPLVELLRKYNMTDRVNVISFGTGILERMKELAPEISVGFLTSAPAYNDDDPNAAVSRILRDVQIYDSTYNPKYNNLSLSTFRAAAHRGITFWPWTVNSLSELNTYFLYGLSGITTNYVQYISDCYKSADTDKTLYTVTAEGVIPLTLTALTYGHKTVSPTDGVLIPIEGSGSLELIYENGVLTASGTGSMSAMIAVPAISPNGNTYYLYTTPFTVAVGVSEEETTEPPTEETTAAPEGSDTASPAESAPATTETAPVKSGGCGSVIGLPSFLAVMAIPFASLTVLKKRKR